MTVKNTGARAGDEVVQLYASAVAPKEPRARKELKGIERISLGVGESRQVAFTLVPNRDFTHYDVAKKAYAVDSGNYEVQIGASSADIRAKSTVAVERRLARPRLLVDGDLDAQLAGRVAHFAARTDAELRQHGAGVVADGLLGQEQLPRDGGVRQVAREQRQHFQLARREPRGIRARRAIGSALQPSHAFGLELPAQPARHRLRAELIEDLERTPAIGFVALSASASASS